MLLMNKVSALADWIEKDRKRGIILRLQQLEWCRSFLLCFGFNILNKSNQIAVVGFDKSVKEVCQIN